MVVTSDGLRPTESAASSMIGRDERYRSLSQSAARPGIQPSAWRPVAASDFGPFEPVQINGAGTAAARSAPIG